VELGSRPGDPGRDPKLEPLTYGLELGPFRIDRKLKTDASGKPMLVSTPTAASAVCGQESGRLCTEVEWERACRADLGLDVGGTAEWTASTTGPRARSAGRPVLRGIADARKGPQECARRRAAREEETAAFRCCYGAPNAPRLAEPTEDPGSPFQIHPLSKEELRRRMAGDPKTEALAKTAEFFSEEAVATVLERGPGDRKGFELTTQPVLWRPDVGVEFLVLTGKAESKKAFVLVYYAKTEPPVLAGSFIMSNEKGPIVLAYADSIRPRIHFSSCWGCPGETGKALFREPESVVLLQP
jgi:hypothetical protein